MGDIEHVEIVRLHIEDDMGFTKIGNKLNRSSRTTKLHIDEHNRAVQQAGFCSACKRANGKFVSKLAEKGNV